MNDVPSTAQTVATRVRAALSQALVGGDAIAFGLLVALFTRGHALIEGVPGTGKTLAVRAFAAALGLRFRRIQFTPDMMPADVVGTTVFNLQTAEFSVRSGPIDANVVLADEINRTPPKTQAALLEAMEEAQVTIDGNALVLPAPFMVCATQNPIEYEGTYPLPEAQLDRFAIKISATYPSKTQELELLERVAAGFDARALDVSAVRAVTAASEILAAQNEVRAVHVAEPIREYIYAIVSATRSDSRLSLGASPRAGVSLLHASAAAAAIDGRTFVTPDDVKDVAPIALPHRLIVQPEAEIEGVDAAAALAQILHAVPVPRD